MVLPVAHLNLVAHLYKEKEKKYKRKNLKQNNAVENRPDLVVVLGVLIHVYPPEGVAARVLRHY